MHPHYVNVCTCMHTHNLIRANKGQRKIPEELGCSSRGPRFTPSTHTVSQLSETLFPEDLEPPLGLLGHQTSTWYKVPHVGKTSAHLKVNTPFKSMFFKGKKQVLKVSSPGVARRRLWETGNWESGGRTEALPTSLVKGSGPDCALTQC